MIPRLSRCPACVGERAERGCMIKMLLEMADKLEGREPEGGSK